METNKSASGLHRVTPMKLVAVAILAMVLVTGCGVGADESYDGQNLVGSNGQALETGPAVGPELPGAATPQTPGTTAPGGVRDPGTVALPQDPIPVFEGRPVTQPPPMMDPSMDPNLVPPPHPGIR